MTQKERDEIVKYRIRRAKETYGEVQVLVENNFLNGAINRLYYSCFYAVLALLTHNEIDTRTHAGARQMFGLHFIKPGLFDQELGQFYTAIFNSRQTGDYDDLVSFGFYY
jgi:uncharacterized protein (UPF0332 family)